MIDSASPNSIVSNNVVAPEFSLVQGKGRMVQGSSLCSSANTCMHIASQHHAQGLPLWLRHFVRVRSWRPQCCVWSTNRMFQMPALLSRYNQVFLWSQCLSYQVPLYTATSMFVFRIGETMNLFEQFCCQTALEYKMGIMFSNVLEPTCAHSHHSKKHSN